MAQQYTYADVKNHNNNQSSWIVIHNDIYDVTAFLNEVRKILTLRFVVLSYLLRLNCKCCCVFEYLIHVSALRE